MWLTSEAPDGGRVEAIYFDTGEYRSSTGKWYDIPAATVRPEDVTWQPLGDS